MEIATIVRIVLPVGKSIQSKAIEMKPFYWILYILWYYMYHKALTFLILSCPADSPY